MPSIGIFDSGVGGLTVLKALKLALPEESFVYLGDTARLPYGTKSPETIRLYLEQNIRFLVSCGVKALVVACNSASTVLASDHWDDLPIYGVIGPGAQAAYAASNGRIGVLGTRATVESNAYVKALHELDPTLEVIQQACPLLVPLVEEGWEQDAVTDEVLRRYLEKPLEAGIDTLILGCTHYPVLKDRIAAIAGENVTLVDSADVIAARVQAGLQCGFISAGRREGSKIFTTDLNHVFQEVGRRILSPLEVNSWEAADIQNKREHAEKQS